MNARRGWIHAPENDQLRVGEILVGHRRHLAVERHVRGTRGRSAQRARQARRAEAPPECRVEIVLREQTVRTAVRKGQDRGAAVPGLRRLHALDNHLERFVPGSAFEAAFSFAALTDCRVEQAIRTVDTLAELADLGADEAAGHGVSGGSVERDDLAVLHGDGHAARIRTVERASRLDDSLRPTERGVFAALLGLFWRSHRLR